MLVVNWLIDGSNQHDPTYSTIPDLLPEEKTGRRSSHQHLTKYLKVYISGYRYHIFIMFHFFLQRHLYLMSPHIHWLATLSWEEIIKVTLIHMHCMFTGSKSLYNMIYVEWIKFNIGNNRNKMLNYKILNETKKCMFFFVFFSPCTGSSQQTDTFFTGETKSTWKQQWPMSNI